jgi:hypothetical protein
MSKEIWIKIGLPGADPQLGTLQGRVSQESFTNDTVCEFDPVERLNDAVQNHKPVKLFDPIVFRAQRDQQGNVLLGALNLVESMPTIDGKFININPANVLWWAQLEDTENWKNVVASTIHHIEITGGNVDFDGPQGPAYPKGPGPRLVR